MSSQSVSEGTFFEAKRRHCLSSSSVFGAGTLNRVCVQKCMLSHQR